MPAHPERSLRKKSEKVHSKFGFAIKGMAGSKSLSRIRQAPMFPHIGVLALVPDEWDGQWQPRHHLMTRLARYFHVVWVNPARYWREMISAPLRVPSPERVPGFEVYVPERWLPKIYHPHWLGRFTLRQRLQRARRLLLRHGCKRIVLYLWRPEFGSAMENLAFDLSCYHIDDEYSFSELEVPIPEHERQLLTTVDQVFIHSPALVAKKGVLNRNTAFVPNGVDYEAFASPQPEPSDMAAIPHPRIGYSGWIKKVLDWPLLLELARLHSEWSFVFVGEAMTDAETANAIRQMSLLSNTYFLGSKSTRQLIAYPQHFDVCIMPYCVNPYTRYIYPMKLHEYLASGRPTISSNIPSLSAFSDVVDLPNTIAQWSSSISRALTESENTVDRRFLRQGVARQHEWTLLAARIARTIRRGLSKPV